MNLVFDVEAGKVISGERPVGLDDVVAEGVLAALGVGKCFADILSEEMAGGCREEDHGGEAEPKDRWRTEEFGLGLGGGRHG